MKRETSIRRLKFMFCNQTLKTTTITICAWFHSFAGIWFAFVCVCVGSGHGWNVPLRCQGLLFILGFKETPPSTGSWLNQSIKWKTIQVYNYLSYETCAEVQGNKTTGCHVRAKKTEIPNENVFLWWIMPVNYCEKFWESKIHLVRSSFQMMAAGAWGNFFLFSSTYIFKQRHTDHHNLPHYFLLFLVCCLDHILLKGA